MRIQARPLALILIGLISVVVPFNARGDTIGTVLEGQQLTINGFVITNPNAFAVTLTGLSASVLVPYFAGPDSGDIVTSVAFAGGSCMGLLGVAGGVAANGTCTVNLIFSTPDADKGEPPDFGVSQITLDNIFNNGPVSSQLFEIEVTDAPVPEPESAILVSLGIAALIGAGFLSKRHGLSRADSSA